MRKIIKFLIIFIYCLFFTAPFFLKAIIYNYCLLDVFKDLKMLIALGMASIFADIYYQSFIGLSFLSFVVLISLARKYRNMFNKVSLSMKMAHAFYVLCGTELITLILTLLCGGTVRYWDHCLTIFCSLVIYFIFEFMKEQQNVERY